MLAVENMRSLTQGILQSYDHRVEALKGLRASVGHMRREMENAHQSMSRGLHASLSQDRQAQQSMSRSLRADLAGGRTRRSSQVKAQLKGLKGFDSAHRAKAQGLRADLAKDCPARRAVVRTMLKGLDRDHQAVAQGMRAELAGGEKERLGAAGALRGELAKGVADRRAAVGTVVKGFQGERAGGQAVWGGLADTMQARRGAAVAVAPAPAPSVEEAAEPTPEFAALCTGVFEYLANQPNGTRLVEMAGRMGVSRFQMSRVLRSLMDQGKVEKRDLSYYAR